MPDLVAEMGKHGATGCKIGLSGRLATRQMSVAAALRARNSHKTHPRLRDAPIMQTRCPANKEDAHSVFQNAFLPISNSLTSMQVRISLQSSEQAFGKSEYVMHTWCFWSLNCRWHSIAISARGFKVETP